MNIAAVNRWLDEEYGCSYTELEKLHNFVVNRNMNLLDEQEELLQIIDKITKENKKLKEENFKLDYQNTRIKGALFEFEMNYYQDNLKGDKHGKKENI